MSKIKAILTPEFALKDILKNLSEQDIMDLTSRTKSLIYKYADPDEKDRQISFRDSMELDKKMKELFGRSPFLSLLTDYLNLQENISDNENEDFLKEVIAIGGRVGDLMNKIKESIDEKSQGGQMIVSSEKELIYDEIINIDNQLNKIKTILKNIK
jgi:hypothetical protein